MWRCVACSTRLPHRRNANKAGVCHSVVMVDEPVEELVEERYWITHRLTCTVIHREGSHHPLYVRRVPRPVDDLVARVTAEARARGAVALFRDHWLPRDWGDAAATFIARAGRLADAFRPRPLPEE
jgi:hypothetical protein